MKLIDFISVTNAVRGNRSVRRLFMTIKKGEREYMVTEFSREWKVERDLGGVAVKYRIPKEAAPDAAAVERIIAENDEIF